MRFTWPIGRNITLYNMRGAQTQFVTKYNYYYLHRRRACTHYVRTHTIICVILLFIALLRFFAAFVFVAVFDSFLSKDYGRKNYEMES